MSRTLTLVINIITASINKAISFFENAQLETGEFKTIAAADYALKEGWSVDSTSFTTPFLLHAFSFYKENPAIETMAKKAVTFLLSQAEGPGIWRYWSKENEKHYSFPPDLDDTCCVASALTTWGESLEDINPIIFDNVNEKGIFYTWLVQRSTEIAPTVKELLSRLNHPTAIFNLLKTGKFNNIDVAVIANILMYVGDCENSGPSRDFLIDLVLQGNEPDYMTYYPDLFTLYYFISRAFHRGVESLAPLVDIISKKVQEYMKTTRPGSLQKKAMALCILHNFNLTNRIKKSYIEAIINEQQPDGSWKGEALFLGPAPYYGSDELTSSFCFEALVRFL